MKAENRGTQSIDQFLSTLRIYNTEIGNYEQPIMLDDTYTYSESCPTELSVFYNKFMVMKISRQISHSQICNLVK